MKPMKSRKRGMPGYVKFMPYCQVGCVVSLLLAVILLVIGYKLFGDNASKSQTFKYIGFAMAAVGLCAFISVIYINSVSESNLIDSMRSFRRSKAANPQIAKHLTRTSTDRELKL